MFQTSTSLYRLGSSLNSWTLAFGPPWPIVLWTSWPADLNQLRSGHTISFTLALSTGAPQGWMHCSLLYSLYTHSLQTGTPPIQSLSSPMIPRWSARSTTMMKLCIRNRLGTLRCGFRAAIEALMSAWVGYSKGVGEGGWIQPCPHQQRWSIASSSRTSISPAN